MESLLAGLRAAAEPTRLRLLALCAHSELTVTDLTHILRQSQPRISRHLKLLCEAGLLERNREGTRAFFRLASTGTGAALVRTLIDLIPEHDAGLARDLERLESIREARQRAATDYFRANAERWDEIRSLYVPEAEVEQGLRDVLGNGPFDLLLDIGTGTGRILQVFGPAARQGIGIDLSQDMLSIARARLDQADMRHCQVRQGDMYDLALPAATADAAVLHMVLHYALEPAAAVAEAARVLRPGGRLAIVDFAEHEQDFLRREHQHHWLGFDPAQVAQWCIAAGLECGQPVRLAGGALTVLIWPARRPARSALTQTNDQGETV
ncbi:MAG: metalloregulator ArsR/SmtB family transcription factor [Alphaproteobacteria bacterium]